jgi:transporter family-2 protein
MNWIYFLLAMLAGGIITTQVSINSQLRHELGNPVLAALFSFCVGTFLLFVYCLVFARDSFSGLTAVKSMSWWKWTGGMMGAIHVTILIMVIQRIGAANMISLIVTGQLLAALLFDHYGVLGNPLQPITVLRIVGVMLIVAGVYLIKTY